MDVVLPYSPQMIAFVAAVAALCIGGYGFFDLIRFSLVRVLAIAHVLIIDAVRRRVLWVLPVVMLGVIVIVQLQRPIDELDAVRQTIKASLFASGLVTGLLILILASTSLGRDIDSKVIFTIVSKPASRLEIVTGKLVGFSGVAALLLGVMLVFTWGLTHVRAAQMGRTIDSRLAMGNSDAFSTAWLEHFQTTGLLRTNRLTSPTSTNVFSRLPSKSEPGSISSLQNAVIPFEVDPIQLIPGGASNALPGAAGVVIELRIPFEQISGDRPFVLLADECQLAISIVSQFDELVVGPAEINRGSPVVLTDPAAIKPVRVFVSEQASQLLAGMRRFMIRISVVGGDHLISLGSESVRLIVPATSADLFRTITPVNLFETQQPAPILRGGFGRRGLRVLGPGQPGTGTARFSFGTQAQPVPLSSDHLDLELRVGVDRSEDAGDVPTRLVLTLTDRKTGAIAPEQIVIPENNRTAFIRVPIASLSSGVSSLTSGLIDADLRVETPGHAIELEKSTMSVVEPSGFFAVNLAKAFFGQWLLAVLIASLALCCSTFLSWHIALVLSVFVLGANWVVEQVGDALASGIGARVALSAQITDTAAVQTVAGTVEGLALTLRTIASYLPNLDYFALNDFVERGLAVPSTDVIRAVFTLVIFAVPAISLAYVALRRKEVAP